METTGPQKQPRHPNRQYRSTCEVCGKEAEFQFLDKIDAPPAKRWRKLCRDHAREFLENMPDSGSGIFE